MEQNFCLTQRVLKSGGMSRKQLSRLVDSKNQEVFQGETTSGLPSKPWRFTDAQGTPVVSFGPNRRLMASSYNVHDATDTPLISIRMPVLNKTSGSQSYDVRDRNGKAFLSLNSADSFEAEQLAGFAIGSRDDLVLLVNDEVVGYTSSPNAQSSGGASTSVASLASGVLDLASQLPAFVAATLKDEFAGGEGPKKDREVLRLTLLGAGTDIDPRIALGILLFKTHVFATVRDVS